VLAGPEAKLDRAIEQLETVKDLCARFVETRPYGVQIGFEEAENCFVARFNGRRALPVQASIRVAEIVHNLRSALEHVAWSLAVANAEDPAELLKPEIRNRITFPIAQSHSAFSQHTLLDYLSDEATAAIETVQPFARRKPENIPTHPLLGLHELWNIDKHRVIYGGVGQMDFSNVRWQSKALTKEDLQALDGGFDVEVIPREGPLHDGETIALVRYRDLLEPPGTVKVDMQGELSVRILFAAGGHAISLDGLEGCCTYVALVLNEVWPIFR
jgi:hypothetical protein